MSKKEFPLKEEFPPMETIDVNVSDEVKKNALEGQIKGLEEAIAATKANRRGFDQALMDDHQKNLERQLEEIDPKNPLLRQKKEKELKPAA